MKRWIKRWIFDIHRHRIDIDVDSINYFCLELICCQISEKGFLYLEIYLNFFIFITYIERIYYNLYIYKSFSSESGTTVIYKSREIKPAIMLTMFTLSEVPSEKVNSILPILQFNFMPTCIYFSDNNFAICILSHVWLARIETLFKKQIFLYPGRVGTNFLVYSYKFFEHLLCSLSSL